jgi:mRNA-degrading endonuclease RelE of RelBE toxin-antitoxin system
MIVEVRSSFQRDAKKLPAQIQHRLFNIIEVLHDASSINEIINCKKAYKLS